MGNRVVQGCRRWLGGPLLVLLIGSLLPGQMGQPVEREPTPSLPRPLPEGVTTLPATLPEASPATHSDALARYRHLALQNQPSLAAYRASLCAAQTKVEALLKIGGLAALVRKDLDIRKEQVHYGVLSAQAQLSVAAWETLYGVTRNYWSAVFAQEQLDLAEEALDPNNKVGLVWLRDIVSKTREEVGARRDLLDWHVTTVDLIIEAYRARRIEAEIGLKRAQAALREAMGVPPDFPIELPRKAKLPWLAVSVHRDEVLRGALTRRGELTQAMVYHQVASLEIKAQEKISGLKGETFAVGSDIHVQPVPMQLANGEYRPGGVGPEMPASLAGNAEDRVQQACHYAARAGIVVDKTKQLLTLQAEEATWKFEKATREVEAYRKVVDLSEEIREKVSSEFVQQWQDKVAQKKPKPDIDDVLTTLVRGGQFRLNLNQARYERLLALTLLERVTAGGVNPGFDEPLPLDQPLPLLRPATPQRKEPGPPEELPKPPDAVRSD